MRALISKCLLGVACRYDGGAKYCDAVVDFANKLDKLTVCPEIAAQLPVPRPPAEQQGACVVYKDGTDVTQEFVDGAQQELLRTKDFEPTIAVLKAKSPSCGVDRVFDGSFTGNLVLGDGIFTQLLKREGMCVVTEEMLEDVKPSVEHPVAIVLGTGLGHLASLVAPVRRIDYHDIDGFPMSAEPVSGHKFEATVGTVDGVPVVVYPGRIHLYQGYSAAEVVSLVRHAHRLGCKDIIFACATGVIDGNATPGLGVLTDHINLTGANPLADKDMLRDLDTPFVGMQDAYSFYLRSLAQGVAKDLGIKLQEGVYAGTLGPSFETAAEVAMLRSFGVSYVGMSTVCEVIMAHALGMNVLGLTLATNDAGDPTVNHETIRIQAEKHADDFERLVRGVLHLL